MMGLGRWFSSSHGDFSSSMLIFQDTMNMRLISEIIMVVSLSRFNGISFMQSTEVFCFVAHMFESNWAIKVTQVPHPTMSRDATWPLCTSPPVVFWLGGWRRLNDVDIIYRNLSLFHMYIHVFFFYGNVLAHDMFLQKSLQLPIEFSVEI